MVEYSVEILYGSSRLDNINTGNMSRFICIQLLSKNSLDSDYCHNYLHTLCTLILVLQYIKRLLLGFINAHV